MIIRVNTKKALLRPVAGAVLVAVALFVIIL